MDISIDEVFQLLGFAQYQQWKSEQEKAKLQVTLSLRDNEIKFLKEELLKNTVDAAKESPKKDKK